MRIANENRSLSLSLSLSTSKKYSHTLLLLSILLSENSLIQIDLHFGSKSEDESKIVNGTSFEAFTSKWYFDWPILHKTLTIRRSISAFL